MFGSLVARIHNPPHSNMPSVYGWTVACASGFGRLLSSANYNPALNNFYRFFQDLTGCKLVAINLEWPISYIFFKCQLNRLHCNDNRPRTWALISKPVFQRSKIMKCNKEEKASLVRHSPNRYKPTTDK